MAGQPAWQVVPTGVTASLRGLAVRAEVIWACGSNGTWLRSADRGKTWTHGVVDGAETMDFRGIRPLDDNTAVMISIGPAEKGQARIYRTTDAGAHWTEVFHGTKAGMFFDAIQFWDKQHGIVVSDPVEGKFAILLTDDGGRSWREAPREHMPDALPKEGVFAASNSGLAVSGNSAAWFGTGGAGKARVFRTNDRGKTWTVVDTPIAADTASAGIFSLYMEDGRFAVAVGGDYRKATESAHNIAVTTDGGRSWTEPPRGTNLFLSGLGGVQEGDDLVIVAVGTGGWAKSGDQQKLWKYGGDQGFNAVTCDVHDVCWAAGAHGVIASIDGDKLGPILSDPKP